MLRSERGIGLVGTMVSAMIVGILVIALLTGSVYSHQAQRNVRMVANFVDLINEVKIIMDPGSGISCRENIRKAMNDYRSAKGRKPNLLKDLSFDPIPMEIAHYTPGARVPFLKAGEEKDGLTVLQMTLDRKSVVGDSRVLMELAVTAAKGAETMGSQTLVHRFPIFVSTDANGEFLSCAQVGGLVEDKICGLMGDGRRYNPVTGTCEAPFERKCYAGTDAYSARCPTGAKVVRGNLGCDSNVVDSAPVTRRYQDGTADTPPAYKCVQKDDYSTECVYAVGVAPGPGTICSVCCNINNGGAAGP